MKLLAAVVLLVASGFSADVGAEMNTSRPMHHSADKEVWDRKANKVELLGHASIQQPGETLTADFATLDLNTRIVDARGNCVYIAPEVVMYGDEMHFNLDSHTGWITNGRVSNDRFTLGGEKIYRIGQGRFKTHRGEYTTCLDCPQSWTIGAQDVDMEVEGYAFMRDVIAKIKDAPVAWSPYLVIPLKTRRQSGVLFPRFGLSSRDGFVFVLPFFWAIHRSADMTFGVGTFAKRGRRLEWEGRYILGPRSFGQGTAFYLKDDLFPRKPSRWAVDFSGRQELPFGVDAKIHVTEAGDNYYPYDVGDVPGSGEPVMASSLMLSRATPSVSTFVEARRYRNLLHNDPVKFDGATVQVVPTAVMTTDDKVLFGGPLAAGLTLGLTNFTRSAGPFDYDNPASPEGTPFQPGVDPVRKAVRLSLVPSLYTSFRPWDLLAVVPSVQYRSFFYSFHGALPSLSRGYLLFQVDLAAQLERVFEFGNEDENEEVSRHKHLIRPLLKYSRIPEFAIHQSAHPFLDQIARKDGYQFDNSDIVPIENSNSYTNYFIPLGDSVSYGFTTQWIRRLGAITSESASYHTMIDVQAGQTFNIKELKKSREERQPYSRYFMNVRLNYGMFDFYSQYFYYPYANPDPPAGRHDINNTATVILERGVRRKFLSFDRSLSVSHTHKRVSANASNLALALNYSLNDFILPSFSIAYDLKESRMQGGGTSVVFQSPSQCWKFVFGLSTTINASTGALDLNTSIDMALNLTGTGFGGVSEVTSSATSR